LAPPGKGLIETANSQHEGAIMTESSNSGAVAPFSRPLAVDTVGEGGLRLKFAATEAECAALAELDGLVALRNLTVEAEATRRGRTRIFVKGQVAAVVSQTCVVTLEPFESAVQESFEIEFAPEAEAEEAYRKAMEELDAAQDKLALLAEQIDPPDPIIDGRIDLGALAAEFLALGLDPYPRSPGASFEEIVTSGEDEKVSPFEALARLKKD
jgi:uncharacterized metal-binding protein YceD (DUF177 family)